jgi:hypothetical protein
MALPQWGKNEIAKKKKKEKRKRTSDLQYMQEYILWVGGWMKGLQKQMYWTCNLCKMIGIWMDIRLTKHMCIY